MPLIKFALTGAESLRFERARTLDTENVLLTRSDVLRDLVEAYCRRILRNETVLKRAISMTPMLLQQRRLSLKDMAIDRCR